MHAVQMFVICANGLHVEEIYPHFFILNITIVDNETNPKAFL